MEDLGKIWQWVQININNLNETTIEEQSKFIQL